MRKSERGESRRGGADDPREQELTDALTRLRDRGVVPWDWITDETRTLYEWECAPSVFAYVMDALDRASINPWGDELPPLYLMESRSLGGVLRSSIALYRCPMAATNGQVRGFLHTMVAPLLANNDRRVLYVGDADMQGNQIEAHTRRVLEQLTGRGIDWTRIALTDQQIDEHGLEPVWKEDGRHKNGGGGGWAVECEALGQKEIERIIRAALDTLLPESLGDVWEREDAQRAAVRRLLEEIDL